jgi:signal transduction histidine kinase
MSDSASSTDEDTVPVDEVRELLSTAYHDLNNPLSIISGNVQFLLEIAREEDLDDQVVTCIEDIGEAADLMADGLDELAKKKEKL